MDDGSKPQTICAVCAGQASGLAMLDGEGSPRWHVCDDPRCTEIVKHWKVTGFDGLTPYEREAVDLAGRAGGKFLVDAGVTDMARLGKDQWTDFMRAIIGSYRDNLQRLSFEKAPPF